MYLKSQISGSVFTAGQLDLPGDKTLPSNDSRQGTPVPQVLLGDEAFGLSKNLLRPYPSKNLSHEEDIQLQACQSKTSCGVYLWNFEQQMACSAFIHSCASKL